MSSFYSIDFFFWWRASDRSLWPSPFLLSLSLLLSHKIKIKLCFGVFFCPDSAPCLFLRPVMKDPPASPVLSDARHSRSAFRAEAPFSSPQRMPYILIIRFSLNYCFAGTWVVRFWQIFLCVRRKRHFWCVLLWKRLGSQSAASRLFSASPPWRFQYVTRF